MTIPWTLATEEVTGRNHPLLPDVDNRPLRYVLSQSGYNPDAAQFSGLLGPVFNVKAFGAKGDNVTNDGAAILAAIAAAAAVVPAGLSAGGSVVYFPPGIYLTSQTIVVPHQVSLIGSIAGVTWIKATSTLPFNGTTVGVVQLGSGTTVVSSSRIQDLIVSGGNLANSIGIYSEWINELSGLLRVGVRDFQAFGVRIRLNSGNSPQNFFIDQLHLIAGAGAGASTIGLDIDGGAGIIRSVTGITFDTDAAGPHAAGIRLNNLSGLFSSIHVENCVAGVLVGPQVACTGLHVEGITGDGTVTSLVEISDATASRDYVISGARKAGATNAILDNILSNTIADNSVALYAVGNGATPPRIILSDAGAFSRLRALQIAQAVEINQRMSVGSFILTYGTTVSTDASQANFFIINAVNGTAFTVANPTNPLEGQELTYSILNSSGGAMGSITWSAEFKLAGTFTNPATGQRRSITFFRSGGAWREKTRTDVDQPT